MSGDVGTLVMTTTDRWDTIMDFTPLPDFTRAGEPGRWDFTDRYGSRAELRGDFLGMGSSHRPAHKHLFPPYADPGQHCSTCRWLEVRIFQEADSDRYLLVRTGRTVVPGESVRTTFGWMESASDVLNSLVTWSGSGAGRLGPVESRALEQAAVYDDDLARVRRAFTEGEAS